VNCDKNQSPLKSPPTRWNFVWSGAFSSLALLILLFGVTPPVAAQVEEPSREAAAEEEPMTGFRAEYLGDMAVLRRKVVGLAEALPAEVYAWAPAEGIRTTSAVFMHLAQTNVNILRGLGREIPAELSGDLEKTTDKEQVIALLKASFRQVRRTVLETSDDELENQVEFFGRTWSERALLYLAATHMHEHLGQAIAYARSNGVAPPWSASAQAAPADGG